MIVGIDPKVDFAFKHLFGREANQELLIDILNQVLQPGPEEQITHVEILNPFNPKETAHDKLSILDVKVRDQKGRLFNIEMQLAADRYLENRLLYYSTRLYQQQLSEGHKYRLLKPVIAICIVNGVRFPKRTHYHSQFELLEKSDHFRLTSDLSLHACAGVAQVHKIGGGTEDGPGCLALLSKKCREDGFGCLASGGA